MKVKKHLITLLTATLVSTNTMPVFAAKKDVWKSKSEINVISREDGSGTRGAFIELIGIEQKNAKGQKVDMTTEEASITNNTSGESFFLSEMLSDKTSLLIVRIIL
jgi:phosphate transport system substrate-binding protein